MTVGLRLASVVICFAVMSFGVGGDVAHAKSKRLDCAPGLTQLSVLHYYSFSHPNDDYHKRGKGVQTAGTFPNSCSGGATKLFTISVVAKYRSDQNHLDFYTQTSPCDKNATGFFTRVAPVHLFKSGNRLFGRAIYALKDSLKRECGRLPDKVRIYAGVVAVEGEPALRLRDVVYQTKVGKFRRLDVIFKGYYAATIHFSENGDYKIVDDDTSLRAQFVSLNGYYDQIRRFDRLYSPRGGSSPKNAVPTNVIADFGISYSSYRPEISERKSASSTVSRSLYLASAIQIESLNRDGSACKAGLRKGDIIWSIRTYTQNKYLKPVAGYWESYSLEPLYLQNVLKEASDGQALTVVWSSSQDGDLRLAKLNKQIGNGKTQSNCRLSSHLMNAKEKEAKEFHLSASGGNVIPLTLSLPAAKRYGEQIVQYINKEKGSSSPWLVKVGMMSVKNLDFPPQWQNLRLDDIVLYEEPYKTITKLGMDGVHWLGSEIHPMLPKNNYFTSQEVAEIVNQIIRYEYKESFFSSTFNSISTSIEKGLFWPFQKDMKLLHQGFGRTSLTDPYLAQRISYFRKEGYAVRTSFILERITTSELSKIAANVDFSRFSSAQKTKEIEKIIRFPTLKALSNPTFQSVLLDHYEVRAGASKHNRTKAWIDHLGPISQDAKLLYFLQMNKRRLEQLFTPRDAGHFYNLNTGRIDKTVTMKRLRGDMTPDGFETLEKILDRQSPVSAYEAAIYIGEKEYLSKRRDYLKSRRIIEYLRHVKPGPVTRS